MSDSRIDAPEEELVEGEAGDAKLKEIIENYDYDVDMWTPIWAEGDIDVEYACGNTWDIADLALRKGRLTLCLDQLSAPLNQAVNQMRRSKRAIKASPAGMGATSKTAELRENRIREIEYASHAQEAYTVAGENAFTRSYGFARIVAEFEDEQSRKKVLRIRAIPNPRQVVPDFDAESTCGRDWHHLTFVHEISKRHFKREWPDAKIQDFSPDVQGRAPRWIKDNRIQIAEYWEVEELYDTEGKPRRKVRQYLTNGVEFLARPGKPKVTPWPGKYIPFAACYGKIVYKQDDIGQTTKIIQSLIRTARPAAKAYNWTRSTQGEALSQVVKSSLIAYKGQMVPSEVQRSIYEYVPLLEANAQTEITGQAILPLPQYGLRTPDISGYEISAESFRRDIDRAMGRFSVTDHRTSEGGSITSGAGLKEQKDQSDLGSYHLADHYDDMIEFIGEQINDLLEFYDDTPGEIATRGPDGKSAMVTVNTPTKVLPGGQKVFGANDLRMDQGKHTVTLSTGPSFDSQHDMVKEAALTLLQSPNPSLQMVAAPRAIKLMDLGPEGDAMADELFAIQPPQVQQARAQRQLQSGGTPDPAVLAHENDQLKQQLQHAEQLLQQASGEVQSKQAEIQSKERIAALEQQTKKEIADLESRRHAETAITVAEINSKAKEPALFMEERARIGVQMAEAASQADAQAHEAARSHQDHVEALQAGQVSHEQAMQQAQQTHDQAIAQAEQGQAHALEQGQQAADLAPEPIEGAQV